MAKEKNKQQATAKGITGNVWMLGGFRMHSLLLVVIGLILYSNTFFNNYALDDGIVILKNEYVQQGFRGIPKILKTDAYESFYRQMNAKQQLSGGRYRPLSVVTFAMEQQLFGSKEKTAPEGDVAGVRHFMNVLLYLLSVVLLYYFLRNFIFKETAAIAFLTALLFLIHPMHTEVVANVKSRDEIMSFLFIVLTFIAAFRYWESKKMGQLAWALFFYFMALLSKEYAISLVLFIPMLVYIVQKKSLPESLRSVLPFLIIAALYMFIRLSVVGLGSTQENPDVLNNPYKFATDPQKWATRIEILNHYLRLLFWPHPLSSDYSYSTIPYTTFGDFKVWASVFIHLSMIVGAIFLSLRRNILGFALTFYLVHLFLISNFLMDIGATMGERLVYHSSLGFVMILAIVIHALYTKLTTAVTDRSLLVIAALFSLVAGIKVIPRNAQWYDDSSLFIADAETVPNSALVNGNAGKAWIDLSERPENKAMETEYVKKSINYLARAIVIHKEYVNGYLNLGVAYFKLKDYERARVYWEKARTIYPNNPYLKVNFGLLGQVYFNKAMELGPKNPRYAIFYIRKALEADPGNAEYWYNLGGASYTIHDYATAKEAWTKTLLYNPAHQQAQQGLAALPK